MELFESTTKKEATIISSSNGNGKSLEKMPTDINNLKELSLNYCQALINSKLLPSWIRTPEQLIAAVGYAKELNLPILTSIKNMYIVNGVPTLTVGLMTALIRRNGHSFRVVKEWETIVIDGVKDAYCEIHAYRKDEAWIKDEKGNPIPHVVKFSWSEAKQMDLTEKQNWKKMPKAMLKARCIAKMARDVFSDICNGFYTPEELDSKDELIFDEEGNVIGHK